MTRICAQSHTEKSCLEGKKVISVYRFVVTLRTISKPCAFTCHPLSSAGSKGHDFFPLRGARFAGTRSGAAAASKAIET